MTRQEAGLAPRIAARRPQVMSLIPQVMGEAHNLFETVPLHARFCHERFEHLEER